MNSRYDGVHHRMYTPYRTRMPHRTPAPADPSGLTRRRWLAQPLGWAALLSWPFAAGCSAPTPPLRVGSLVFPGYELVFLARESGWLDPALVRLIEMRSNTDALRALASGQLEAAAFWTAISPHLLQ